MNRQKSSRAVFAQATIGLRLAITILAFVYLGYKLDNYYNRSPLFISIGSMLGMALGFYNLIKELLTAKDKEKNKEERDNEKRSSKWM